MNDGNEDSLSTLTAIVTTHY